MYTWEIDDLVRARGNILSVQEYIQVCRSPQVDHIKRDGDRVQILSLIHISRAQAKKTAQKKESGANEAVRNAGRRK